MRALVALLLLAIIGGIATLIGSSGLMAATLSSSSVAAASVSGSSSCAVPIAAAAATNVSMASLNQRQISAAHTIWTVAHETGMGDRGAIVGIATAMQESTLDANPATRELNSDGDVALFQQRALLGWYAPGTTVDENIRILSDYGTAARTFFLGHKVTAGAHAAARAAGQSPAGPIGYTIPGLIHVDGWRELPVTVAAQKVQRSAFPNAYAKHEQLAATLVQRFNAETAPPAATIAETSNPALCDPAGAVNAASCPDSGLRVEQGLTPDAVRVLRCTKQQFPQITSYGGVRADSLPDHPSGRAVDIMIPGSCDPLGQQVADWLRANASSMGVDYLIWCQKIWSVGRSPEGWRTMGDRGSLTENHADHVHVTVNGNSAGTAEAKSGAAGGGAVSPVEKYTLTARYRQAGPYWSSGFHTGLDFAATGQPEIRAVKDGTVKSVTVHAAYGNLVTIEHADGIETWYAHLSSVAVRPGQSVAAGHVVGRMGATGNVTGEHLHFEVRSAGGSLLDPDALLKSWGVVLVGSRA